MSGLASAVREVAGRGPRGLAATRKAVQGEEPLLQQSPVVWLVHVPVWDCDRAGPLTVVISVEAFESR